MKTVIKMYRMSIPKLAYLADDIHRYMTRDFDKFQERGVTLEDMNEYKELFEKLKHCSADSNFVGKVNIESTVKKECKENIFKMLKTIKGYFAQINDVLTLEYKRVVKLTNQCRIDSGMIASGEEILQIADENFETLSKIGLTRDRLTELKNEIEKFKGLVLKVHGARAERRANTQDRNVIGNAVYAKMTKFAKIGRLIWEDVDAVKYKEYIIYTSLDAKAKIKNTALLEAMGEKLEI